VETAEVILMLGLTAIALWERHIILYVGAFLGLLFFGIYFAETSYVLGVTVFILAAYMFFKSITYWFRR